MIKNDNPTTTSTPPTKAMNWRLFFLLWLACYGVSQTFPRLLEAIGPAKTFWTYGAFSLASWFFVVWMLPETKGRTLEEIQAGWRK